MAETPKVLSLSSRLYPLHCIDLAARAFGELCAVAIEAPSEGQTLVRVSPLVEGHATVVEDFLNYALMASLEWHLAGRP